MRTQLPATVTSLLDASDDFAREAAWAAFMDEFGPLILHVARAMGGGHDAVMDRYAYALERLRRDESARLRRYLADGRGKFSTWLVVVVRRLCLDEHRQRYGRERGSPSMPGAPREERRQLADLVSAEVDVDRIESDSASPEAELHSAQVLSALDAALAGLEPRDRLLLRLRFEDGLSVPEAARVLGLPSPFHGYRRLAALMDTLRLRLRDSGVEDGVL